MTWGEIAAWVAAGTAVLTGLWTIISQCRAHSSQLSAIEDRLSTIENDHLRREDLDHIETRIAALMSERFATLAGRIDALSRLRTRRGIDSD